MPAKTEVARKLAASYLKAHRSDAMEEGARLYEKYGGQRAMGFADGFDAAIRYLNGLKNYPNG